MVVPAADSTVQSSSRDGTNQISSVTVSSRGGASVKIAITPCQPKTLTNLPKRPPVDIAFSDLTYTVAEGKKKSKS